MTDSFLEDLKADWNRYDADSGSDLEPIRRALAWRQMRRRLFIAGEVVGSLVALGMATWLGFEATATGSMTSALGSGALATGGGLSIWSLIRSRMPGGSASATADGLGGTAATLAAMLEELRHLEQVVSYWFRSAGILLVCAVGIGLLNAAGLAEEKSAVVLSMVWTGTAATLIAWGLWRRRRIGVQRAVCLRLQREMGELGSEADVD